MSTIRITAKEQARYNRALAELQSHLQKSPLSAILTQDVVHLIQANPSNMAIDRVLTLSLLMDKAKEAANAAQQVFDPKVFIRALTSEQLEAEREQLFKGYDSNQSPSQAITFSATTRKIATDIATQPKPSSSRPKKR